MLDIDDTVDVVHGHQQLSLFNAHDDERCLPPLHISYLRHDNRAARRRGVAAGQDALGMGDRRSSAAALSAHPPALAGNQGHAAVTVTMAALK